jgi:hypothetical protein
MLLPEETAAQPFSSSRSLASRNRARCKSRLREPRLAHDFDLIPASLLRSEQCVVCVAH